MSFLLLYVAVFFYRSFKNRKEIRTQKDDVRVISKVINELEELDKLKENEILKEEEYNEAVLKVNELLIERKLQLNADYISLVKLKEQGIISNSQFELKIQLIRNKILPILDLKQLKNKNSTKTDALDPTGLGGALLILIVLVIVLSTIILLLMNYF
jgi:hypothetical protein